ncbi:Cellulose synthase operon protein C [Klebsiella pneumoniae IS22]|nr:Cellulose synthase operon protein C [Klebsiella pneumoniae IS22]
MAQQSGAQGASAKLFRADVLRHNKDLPQAEQTLRSLLNDDPQNAAARENLYYVLREQNKSAEAQAMLQTLPQSLRQKLQPRVVAGMPGDALRRQAQAQVSGGNPAGAIATLREGVARYPDDPWLRLDLARLLQKSGNGSEASSLMSAAIAPAPATVRCMPPPCLPAKTAPGSRRRRCWRAFPAAARPATCAICASG